MEDQATVGGMVAAGLSGPRRPWSGAVRDLVLGTRVITGQGKLLRFGGEVMRGFYPELQSITPKALSQLYDVNAGSHASQDAFSHFIEQASWKAERLYNHPLEVQFYWEHRMGTWGASALSESDMAFRGIPGYNSRELFEVFAGLGKGVDRRQLFEAAAAELQPAIGSIPYSS